MTRSSHHSHVCIFWECHTHQHLCTLTTNIAFVSQSCHERTYTNYLITNQPVCLLTSFCYLSMNNNLLISLFISPVTCTSTGTWTVLIIPSILVTLTGKRKPLQWVSEYFTKILWSWESLQEEHIPIFPTVRVSRSK